MPGNLQGTKIIVTRPAVASKDLIETLTQLEAHVVSVPLFAIEALLSSEELGQLAQDLPRYDLVICISRNAAEIIAPYLTDLATTNWATIGPGTASFLRQLGILNVIYPPLSPFDSNSLLLELQLRSKTLKNQCIIILTGADGDSSLAEALQQCGARVRVESLYKRTMPKISAQQLQTVLNTASATDIMVVTCVTSLTNLQTLAESARLNFFNIPLLVVSSRISTYALERGFVNVHVAKGMSDADIVTALLAWRNSK